MLNIVIHLKKSIGWHIRYLEFFKCGFERHGIKITTSQFDNRIDNCDIAILFGPNHWKNIEAVNKPYILVNKNFFGDIDDDVTISWDGFNGLGTFCVDEVDPKRLRKFIDPDKEIKEWKTDGKDILLCGQHNLGRCTNYRNLEQWYNEFEGKIKNLKFRPHPTKGKAIALEQQLNTTKYAITLNSTIAVEILMKGVPVIATHEGNPVYSICGHTINELKYPDRLSFFQYLAHCQWNYREIIDGTFWEHIYPKRGPKLYEWETNKNN